MASSSEYLTHVLELLREVNGISYKKDGLMHLIR